MLSRRQKKIYLYIQSVLCALTAGALAAAAIRIYTEDVAIRATDLFYNIYTREKAGSQLIRLVPLMAVTFCCALAGWILGIKGEWIGNRGAIPEPMPEKAVSGKTGGGTMTLRTMILVLAMILIVLGILNGGLEDVFAKGAAICTECVGLG